MRLSEILSADRILVDHGATVRGKPDALHRLAEMVSPAIGVERSLVEALLTEREQLQSTGIGDGVAIPHTSVEEAESQSAALILCPHGIPFDAIDAQPVTIVFGLVGPKRNTGEHLRTLARISRLLREPATRARLIASPSAEAAYDLISQHDAKVEVKT
jgi:PTS system nitrogen regulatory IIA component